VSDLLTKLQVKPGQAIALVGGVPEGADGWPLSDDPERADAVLLYVRNATDLTGAMEQLRSIAGRGALCWVVYPKDGKLGTDLNRDRIRESLVGLDTVRQVAVDETWSALRLKPA
jgi:hypothetical protein